MYPRKISYCVMKHKDYLGCQPKNSHHESFGFNKKKNNQLTDRQKNYFKCANEQFILKNTCRIQTPEVKNIFFVPLYNQSFRVYQTDRLFM